MELLSKTRVINGLVQRSEGMRVGNAELLQAMRDIIFANVFLVNPAGTLLAHSLAETLDYVQLPADSTGVVQISREHASKYLREDRSLVNQTEETPFCRTGTTAHVSIIPVQGNGDRIGTMVLTKHTGPFSEEDILLAEYSATVLGLEMTRAAADRIMQEGRDRSIVQMAVGSLSYSELEAVDHIFAELNGREGLLVASRIADRAGITRSVIVNALRKLESAGVVEARSLGMKGTHIKILNEKLLPILEDIKSR